MRRAPNGLGIAGNRLWREIMDDVPESWEFDNRDLSWLEQAAHAADRIAELESVIEQEGLTVAGSKGQSRLHPAIQEIRMTRQLLSHLLSKIQTQPPAEKTGHLSGRQRAQLRDARRARWQ